MELASDLRRIGRGCNLLLTVFKNIKKGKNIKSLQSRQNYTSILGFNSQFIVSLQLFKAVAFKGGQENRVS